VAHRGAPTRAPEHTIPAYEAAIEAGADDLALDLRLSADDHLVVIHDARLERTTDGRGRVRDHTARELKRLDAGGWFGPRYRGQRVQTLHEVLERFRDRVGFVLRLPDDPEAGPPLEERVVGPLQIYDVLDRTLVASADPGALGRARRLDFELRTGLIVRDALPGPDVAAAAAGATAVWLSGAATPRAVAAVTAAGLECYAGPVDEADAARRLAGAGVTGIVTARIDLLRRALPAAP
jgi:glycerophosphoryl diester phosphodiesterase